MSKLTGTVIVADAKVSRYLLDEAHPDGGPKARFLKAFGFSQSHPNVLRQALVAHAGVNPVISTEATCHGLKSVVECNITTPDGRNPCIWTIWVEEPGADTHRFVTAYPKR